MAITRSMTINQDASCGRKRPTETSVDIDDGDSRSWSYLIPDILVSVISRLGVIDFVSFSCVCKSWRTFALSNKNIFMLSRQPMHLRMISTRGNKKKKCSLEDLEGRKFMTILPRSSHDICLGLVSGYLIFFRSKTHDFRLVNPITRHELNFPRIDFGKVPDPENFRCTLVFSPTRSKWVFVALIKCSSTISFSFSIKPAKSRANSRAHWTRLRSDFLVSDLHFFQGKIYALCKEGLRLYEVILSPTPKLTLLKMKENLMYPRFIWPDFATWGEKLYAVALPKDRSVPLEFEFHFEQMRWVKPTQALKEVVFFVNVCNLGVTKLELWMDLCEQYERIGWFNGTAKNYGKGINYTLAMWYFPHKCLDVNLLRE